MGYQAIPGLAFNGKQVYVEDGIIDVPPPPVVKPPVTSLVLPFEWQGRKILTTPLYTGPAISQRIFSHGFNDGTIWQINFQTGPYSDTRLSFRGANYGGTYAQRVWAILRRDSGLVVGTGKDSTTVSVQALISTQPQQNYIVRLDPFTQYALLIRNQNIGGGEMYMDLDI